MSIHQSRSRANNYAHLVSKSHMYLWMKREAVSVEDIEAALTDQTILVSVIHVNNEVGTIQPIKEIGQLLKNHPKVLFHVDHVQGAGKVPLRFICLPHRSLYFFST